MTKRTAFSPLLSLLLAVLLAAPCAAAGGARFYPQLSTQEAALCDAMAASFDAGRSSFSFTLSPPRDCPEGVQEAARTLALRAFEAYCRDHPENFWIGKTLSYTPTTGADQPQRMLGLEGSVEPVKLPSSLDAARLALNNAANEILSGLSGTDAAQVRALHDAVVARCQYDQSAASSPAAYPLSYEAYGALVTGKATCEGYAKAFKLLCDRAGIPCILVAGTADGTNHMWNEVQIGARWYLVDCTFDDPIGGQPNSDYLLKGQASASGHLPEKSLLKDFDPQFVMPTLSNTDYVFGASEEAGAAQRPKESCRVSLSSGGNGRCTVKYTGNTGTLDPGQQVPGGIALMVNALPDPGFSLSEISVTMGGVRLSEREKNSLCFVVTDDCSITVSFQPQN